MKTNNSSPTGLFWNFAGASIVILSVSMFRATNFKLEAANNKLEVNRAVEQIKKVSDTLDDAAQSLPPKQQKEIRSELEQASSDLELTQLEILNEDNQKAQ